MLGRISFKRLVIILVICIVLGLAANTVSVSMGLFTDSEESVENTLRFAESW